MMRKAVNLEMAEGWPSRVSPDEEAIEMMSKHETTSEKKSIENQPIR